MLEYIFTETIYGPAILAGVAYFVVSRLKRKAWREEKWLAVPFIVFLVALIGLGSYPRYKFEKETLEVAAQAPHIRLVAQTRRGALVEPLTWFVTPIGYFRFVGPSVPTNPGFDEIVMTYDEASRIRHYAVFCDDRQMGVSEPDGEGTYRYISPNWIEMSDEDFKLFCATDWSTEKEALRNTMLNAGN